MKIIASTLLLLLITTSCFGDPTLVAVGWNVGNIYGDVYFLDVTEAGSIVSSTYAGMSNGCFNYCPMFASYSHPENNEAFILVSPNALGNSSLYRVDNNLAITQLPVPQYYVGDMTFYQGAPLLTMQKPNSQGYYLIETWDISSNSFTILYNISDPKWQPSSVTIDPENSILYTIPPSNSAPVNLVSLDLNTGKVNSFTTQIVGALEINVFYSTALKTLYAVDANSYLWSVDTTTGNSKKLALLGGFSWTPDYDSGHGGPVLDDAKSVLYWATTTRSGIYMTVFSLQTLTITSNGLIQQDGSAYGYQIPLVALVSS